MRAIEQLISSFQGSVPKLCEGISAENLLKFTLRPYAQLGLDKSVIPSSLTPSEIIDELISEIPEITDAAEQISQIWRKSQESKRLSPVQDDVVMIEEPWINENASKPDKISEERGEMTTRE
uniref:Uncharacterized protein n=1 Tax=Nelumbo nucifera TaxID=4432 RepID=A0A822XYY1_NELNU|nr:TPA_asm: hypothetical protein HUJ06_028312 [Nelumbo nucifera]